MALHSDRIHIDVIELPERDRNGRLQTCRVSQKLAEMCHLTYGQCVLIKTPHDSAICQALPLEVYDPEIQYDPCVTLQGCNLNLDPKQIEIHPLDCREGKQVCVKVILKDHNQCKRFHTLPHVQRDLAAKILQCLRNVCVAPGCTVDLTGSKLAELYGITLCQVLQCCSESGPTDSSSSVKITQKTAIKITDVQSWECYELLTRTLNSGMKRDLVIGLNRERRLLADLLKSPENTSVSRCPGVLLRGPPGCGKTSLVRQVAVDCKAALLEVNSAEVLSSDAGESERNLVSLFDKAERVSGEAPCVLFFDKAEALCSGRGSSGSSSHKSRVTSTLLGQLDRADKVSGLLVVMATNRPSDLDPGLRRSGRVDKEILIPVPTTNQREKIFAHHLGFFPLANDLDLAWLASATPGYVGADIEAVCVRTQRTVLHQISSQADTDRFMERRISHADMMEVILLFTPTMQRGVDCVVGVPRVQWSDIGGLEEVKLQIQQAIEWPLLHPETYQALGLPLTKGVLLHGPPGCGKTTLVQAAANASHVSFLSLSCAELYSPHVGDSEKKVVETFQKARAMAPSILFLDEVDSIVGKRSDSSSGSGVSERVLSALLNEMDGVGVRLDDKATSSGGGGLLLEGEGDGCRGGGGSVSPSGQLSVREAHDGHVLVVAATNRLDMLDAALLRPGRMDRLIYVPPPDKPGRLQSFRIHTQKMPLAQDMNLSELAELTEGYTGADVKALCKEAGLLAMEESMDAQCVRWCHFVEALRDCAPSLSSDVS